MTEIVMSFCALCMLLLAGKVLRTFVPLLQRLYLPSSVIGGIIGLVVLTLFGDRLAPGWTAGWRTLPGFLINIIFAGLFLGTATPKLKTIWKIAAPQLCLGQLLAWGQYAVGLALTGLVLMPLFGVPPIFGNLLEIGFEGGHGTVAGMAHLFAEYGWPEGRDLGVTMATGGMVCGIVLGMVLVNWAARTGKVENVRDYEELETHERRGLYAAHEQPAAGRQTIASESLDSLAFHVALIGLAILAGCGIRWLLVFIEAHVMPETVRETGVLSGIPLFPLAMFGGLAVQKLAAVFRINHLVDHGQMVRIGGASLDFLVVSAVACINLTVVRANWAPLLILMTAGVVWSVFCVVVLAPRIFNDAVFERAIAEFGQSTGVTATGLLLLRTVDAEGKTNAGKAFGYKQLLHEPFMGGGLWTAAALPLVATMGWLPVLLISLGAMVFWLCFGLYLKRR